MEIGIALPSGVPGVDGRTVLWWAWRADQGPFSSVSVLDRLRYANFDVVATLGAVAAATRRVRLVANVMLPALRHPAWFAKEVATLAELSAGRLSLGIGVGARRQDFEEVGVDWNRRGTVLDTHLAALTSLRDARDEQQLGPVLRQPVEILIGGASAPALRRLVTHGHGYISGGLKPTFFSYEAAASCAAWAQSDRPGRPRLVAGTWFSRSTVVDDAASAWLRSYLWQGGPPAFINAGIARGADAIAECIAAFRAHGADEVIMVPTTADPAELDWFADLVAGLPEFPRGEPSFPTAPPAFDPHATVPGTHGVVIGGDGHA